LPGSTTRSAQSLKLSNTVRVDQITEDSPIHLQAYHWASYLKVPGIPQYHEWVKADKPTGSYTGAKSTYLLEFDYNKCEDYGSEVGMVNHALEVCFGCRGSSGAGWSIWIRGDHLITLFRDIKDEYQRLMAVEEES
jgi:hypothetical protein